MRLYRILSALLDYPQQDMLDALPDIAQALDPWPEAQHLLKPLIAFLGAGDLIAAQENYVSTFDRNPAHALHLFEHIHGESRDRGQAMVDLLEEYRRSGFEPKDTELPDHVPLFLEFLSLLDEVAAEHLLGEAIHVLAAIGSRLARNESPYAAVFIVLPTLTSVAPRQQDEPPVRDMDDAMEIFGVGADGVEPLLRQPAMGEHMLRFHPRVNTV